jgi:hypothetical protein
MESTLLSGRFSTNEAEQLLAQLYKVKKNFHLAKIDLTSMSEEDIKHSERRILDLESELKKIVAMVRSGSYRHVAIQAKIVLEFCPDYQNA